MTATSKAKVNPKRLAANPSPSGKRRAWVLIGVHLLFAIHLAQWLATGETITPVEPSEAKEALETGAVNVGAIFFLIAILSTAIFGRWFCGWGCHLVALQDACGALMRRIGIRPRLFRTRTLIAVPYLTGFYLFLWPATYRMFLEDYLVSNHPTVHAWIGQSKPYEGLHLDLMRDDFWLTFPGVGITIVTFLICGFLIVYLLGAKGFCTYGCPYGAFFAVADRVAPGRIQADLSKCESCGHCTAHCTSNVQIHKEIKVYESVVDSNCMKCMDCVQVCPTGALSFGFSKPSLIAPKLEGTSRPKRTYDTSLLAELGLWIVGLASFYAIRGAYGLFPLLLSVGLAGCYVFLTWKFFTLFTKRNVSLVQSPLKHAGKLTGHGFLYVSGFVLITAFFAHSFVLNVLHQKVAEGRTEDISARGWRGFEGSDKDRRVAGEILDDYTFMLPFWRGGAGLFPNREIHIKIARVAAIAGDLDLAIEQLLIGREDYDEDFDTQLLARFIERRDGTEASETFLRRAVSDHPDFGNSRMELVELLDQKQEFDAATELALIGVEATPKHVGLRDRAARGLLSRRNVEGARELLEEGLEIDDHATGFRVLLAKIDLQEQNPEAAKRRYLDGLEIEPQNAALRTDYARLLFQLGDVEGAEREHTRAIDDAPNNLGVLRVYVGYLLTSQRFAEAIPHIEHIAENLAPNEVEPASLLSELYDQIGQPENSERWRKEAASRQEAAASDRTESKDPNDSLPK